MQQDSLTVASRRTQAIPEWVRYGISLGFLENVEGIVRRNAVQRDVLVLRLLN